MLGKMASTSIDSEVEEVDADNRYPNYDGLI